MVFRGTALRLFHSPWVNTTRKDDFVIAFMVLIINNILFPIKEYQKRINDFN
jgi:hypothetical protein